MIKSLLALLALILSVSGSAWGAQWTVDKAQSRIVFIATFEGAEFEGRFTRYDADLRFDEQTPIDSRFEVRIDLLGTDTGSSELNEGMQLSDWFDSGRFPQATFISSEIRATGKGRFLAIGALSIKGITREVRLPFAWNREGTQAVIDGETTLKRTDFLIGAGDWSSGDIVGLPVKLTAHLVLSRVEP